MWRIALMMLNMIFSTRISKETGKNMTEVDIYGETISLKTKSFSGEAIRYPNMPGFMVLDTMLTSPGHEAIQMAKVVTLFQLAIVDQKGKDLEVLTFNELTEVLQQWLTNSPAKT